MNNRITAAAAAAAVLTAAPALAGTAYDEAEVIDVEPVYQTVRHVTPHEECRMRRVPVRTDSATAPIVGAVVGGAIGNAVGHNKRNKQVGAVVGAVLGGAIASDMVREQRRYGGGWRRQEICREVNEISFEEELAGYDVTYRYAGRVHTARMSRDPGETLRVRVRVNPA